MIKQLVCGAISLLVGMQILWAEATPHVIATVDERIITSKDISSRTDFLNAMRATHGEEPLDDSVGPYILQQLIDEMIITNAATRFDIAVSEEEISENLMMIESSLQGSPYHSLMHFIGENHLSLEHIRQHVVAQMLWFKVVARHIQPRMSMEQKRVQDLVSLSDSSSVTLDYITITLPGPLPTAEIHDRWEAFARPLNGCYELETALPRFDSRASLTHRKEVLSEAPPAYRSILALLPTGKASHLLANEGHGTLLMICTKITANRAGESEAIQRQQHLYEQDFLQQLRQAATIDIVEA